MHTKEIKCPNCSGPGHSYEEEGRLYYKCDGACQMVKLLKLLNIKSYAIN